MNPEERTILVVEDELIPRKELVFTLKELGYSVVGETAKGELALEIAADTHPTCVLMDIHLAGRLDGIETATALHREYNIPVIFTTSYSDTATRERAKSAEPYGYILKPLDVKELEYVLDLAIHRHQREQRLREHHDNLHALFNNNGHLFFVCGPDNRIVEANETASNRLEYPPEELLGKSIEELLNEKPALFEKFTKTAETGDPRVLPMIFTTRTGDPVPVRSFFKTGTWNGEQALFITCRETAGEKGGVDSAMLAALTQSETNLCALIENTSDCMWSVNREHRLLTSNTSFNDLYTALRGRKPAIGDIIIADTDTESGGLLSGSLYDRALAGEHFTTDLTFENGTGETCWEASFYPIRDGVGTVTGVACFARDITERKKEHDEIAIIKKAVDGTSDAVSILSTLSGGLYVNPAFERIFSFTGGAELLQAGGPEILFADAAVAAEVETHMQQGKPWSGEVVMRSRDGEEKWILLRADRITGENGEVLGLISIYTDNTAARAIRKKLDESEDKLNRLASSISDILYSVDGNSEEFSYLSPSFERILGYTLEDIDNMGGRKKFLQQVIEGDAFAEQEKRYRKLAGHEISGGNSWEAWWQCKDGTRICLEDRFYPVFDGDTLVSTDGVLRDITGRKIVEQAILASENKYRSLFNQIADPIFIFSTREHRFLDCNEAALRTYGYSLEELKEMQPYDLHPEEDLETVRANIDTCNRDRGNSYTHITKSGKQIYVNIRTDAVQYQGKPAFISIVRDETRQKMASEQLNKAKNKAEESARTLDLFSRELELKNIKLEKALKRAEESKKLKAEFLANMGHEIRTPMTAIIGMTSLATDLSTDDEQRSCLELVSESSKNLLGLLNDILDYSKIEADRIEIYTCPFSVEELISNLQQEFASRAAAKHLTLTSTVSKDMPEMLTGDSGRIRQILINLVNNAVKFTGEGEIVISAESMGRAAAKKGAHGDRITVQFSVTDTGIGIEHDRIESIFDSFVQGDGSATRKYGGTGLGLAICKELVELMGGSISVESRAGAGSRFFFTLPLQIAEGAAPVVVPNRQAETAAEAGESEFSCSVLVAEDDPINQLVIEKMLMKLGCRVDIAADGKAALEAVNDKEYDLVFMDIQMPVLNGLDAVRKIRNTASLGPKRRVPIIALTVHAYEKDRQRCLNAGMNDYLLKPIAMTDIKKKLQRYRNGEYGAVIPAAPRVEDSIDMKAILAQTGGREALLKKTCETYRSSAEELLRDLETSIKNRDAADISKIAHSLETASASIGGKRAQQAASAVETAARSNNYRLIAAKAAVLRHEVGNIISVLPSIYSNAS
ncbi:PAS domain S-box protein [bacterium]|nr:PAS domain S-box protein [bacterium]